MRQIKRLAATMATTAAVLATAATSAHASPLPGGGAGQTLPALYAILAFVRRTLG
ncbi:exported protein of unknown function [Streptomyces ambofaciens ATCC 23877]|uniref:Secreted protein n=1 Tax=Streptomyces ambofaciens (strain ATCC 23877 / 3486 / DSM 40053 / JCM 4204 / NBRC 12836 / NRRL B-2516) TaxID=278992 RepID=A0A0K2AKQ9_STRA7|nr:hypothetical protein [Streptomyces ambofaciens]AKZ53670.1 exported protein of unknown function [Streptomyces ambofaciens ATCC 23877]